MSLFIIYFFSSIFNPQDFDTLSFAFVLFIHYLQAIEYTYECNIKLHFEKISWKQSSRWFYALNPQNFTIYQNKINPKSLENVKLKDRYFKLGAKIDPSSVLKSIVYVGHFNNAYLGIQSSVHNHHIQFYHKQTFENKTIKIIGNYNVGVVFVQHFWQWGHMIHDFLTSIMYLPQNVLNNEFVLVEVHNGRNDPQKWLYFLGLKAKLIRFTENQKIFVKRLYFVTGGSEAHSVTVGGIPRLRKFIKQKFILDQIKPTKYCLFNRDTVWRHIENFDEIYKILVKEIILENNEKWIQMTPNFDNLSDVLKIWSEIKVLIAPSGSMIYNSIFMREKTGLLLFMGHFDEPNIQLCLASNIYMIAMTYNKEVNLKWNFAPNPQEVVVFAKNIINIVNTGKWMWTNNTIPGFTESDYDDKKILDFDPEEYNIDLKR